MLHVIVLLLTLLPDRPVLQSDNHATLHKHNGRAQLETHPQRCKLQYHTRLLCRLWATKHGPDANSADLQLVLDMGQADVQAWGNLLNLAVLLFFMAVLGQYGPTYNPTRLSIVWRLQYGLG